VFSLSKRIKLDNTLCRVEVGIMSYREGAEKFYDLFGAKDDAPFYIELAHVYGNKALELGVGTARLEAQELTFRDEVILHQGLPQLPGADEEDPPQVLLGDGLGHLPPLGVVVEHDDV
jgi:hypothetical protein